jgi:hypothetical protein
LVMRRRGRVWMRMRMRSRDLTIKGAWGGATSRDVDLTSPAEPRLERISGT